MRILSFWFIVALLVAMVPRDTLAAPVPASASTVPALQLSCSDCLQNAIEGVLSECSQNLDAAPPAECKFISADAEMLTIANFYVGYFNSEDFDERKDTAATLLNACRASSFPFGFERYLKRIVSRLEILELQKRCDCPELRYQTKAVAEKCFDEDASQMPAMQFQSRPPDR